MNSLASSNMSLSASERRWLPFFGASGKFAMTYACAINRQHYSRVEYIFENLAKSRVKALQDWATGSWDILEGLAEEVALDIRTIDSIWLRTRLDLMPEFSELMLIDNSGKLLSSSNPDRAGVKHQYTEALQQGLIKPFLHGPYADPETLRAGATTSEFHDEMTLMFYQPIVIKGKVVACLCARVPNDVMSDYIQRESGHVYKGSGDNYVFMVNSHFDSRLIPGTALSRSRFEDESVIAGPNLKSGITTPFNTVRVSRHTELELILTDPSTGGLHPGVRETIKHGNNLFVTYPGYSDYRHVPVIGKGLSFKMPGSLDTWGLMCEADLAEVYSRRPLGWRFAILAVPAVVLPSSLAAWLLGMSTFGPTLITGLVAVLLLYMTLVRPLSARLEGTLLQLVGAAEGGRIDASLNTDSWSNDVMRELGLWVNSMTGKVLETVGSVKMLSLGTRKSCESMGGSTRVVLAGSDQQMRSAETMSSAVEELTTGIGIISDNSQKTSRTSITASELTLNGRELMSTCNEEIQRVSLAINQAAEMIERLNERSDNIGSIIETISAIAEQTNLLALNAAIEAARAGDQGRGFAVVADEVRSLAARTALSTSEIKTMIVGMQQDVGQAVVEIRQCSQGAGKVVSIAREADTSLGAIETSIEEVRMMIGDIAASTEQQNLASNEISSNLARLATASEANHRALTQTATTVQNMQRMAGLMDRLAKRLHH